MQPTILIALSENRRDVAEADEDGGGGDGEFFSAGEPLSTGRKEMPCGETQGTVADIF